MSHQATVDEIVGSFLDDGASAYVGMEGLNVSINNSTHELLYVQLRRAVGNLGEGAQKFFNFFKLSETVRMDKLDDMMKLLPPGVDLKVISSLPAPSQYEEASSAFLRMLNDLQIVQNLLKTVDQDYPSLQEEDKLFVVSLKASLLCELIGRYAFFWYNQLKLATQREVLFNDLKSVENEIACFEFPQRLRVMSKDYHLAPNMRKQSHLKQELEQFCDHLDGLSERYRHLQRQLFNKYDVDVHYNRQTLPGFQELADKHEKGVEFFRMSFIHKVKESVAKLMGNVVDSLEEVVKQRDQEGRAVYHCQKTEDKLESLFDNLSQLQLDKLRNVSQLSAESMSNLSVPDESLLAFFKLVQDQVERLNSVNLKHLLVFEDDNTCRSELAGSEMFASTLFELESESKLAYSQIAQAEKVIQSYLDSKNESKDFAAVNKLLVGISELKSLWVNAETNYKKSKMLLDQYCKKSSVSDKTQKNLLQRCTLPLLTSSESLAFAEWKIEFMSLIDAVQPEMRLRCLKQALEKHKFALSLVRFQSSFQEAMNQLDKYFSQKDTIGVKLRHEILKLPYASESIYNESKIIRSFLDIHAQILFNQLEPSQVLGPEVITHVAHSLCSSNEYKFISLRVDESHADLPVSQQYSLFIQFLEGILDKNNLIIASRKLRERVSGEKPSVDNSTKPGKFRDLPSKPQGFHKKLEVKNSQFDKKGKKPNYSEKNKENTVSCHYCKLTGHNVFSGKCAKLSSKLLDNDLIASVEKAGLCKTCLHPKKNAGSDNNGHICKTSFTYKDREGKSISKSIFCPKLCRDSGGSNQKLHKNLCPCSREIYRNKLKMLESKTITFKKRLVCQNSAARKISTNLINNSEVGGPCRFAQQLPVINGYAH